MTDTRHVQAAAIVDRSVWPHVAPCESVFHACGSILSGVLGLGTDFVYRGQGSSDWPLASLWHRELEGVSGSTGKVDWSEEHKLNKLANYLTRFRQSALGVHGFDPRSVPQHEDQREWWALGRHFGLITPLLDWTRSPYIAAYFAVMQAIEQQFQGIRGTPWRYGIYGDKFQQPEPVDVAIWVMATDGLDKLGNDFLAFSSELGGPAGQRQKAQLAVFTWCKDYKTFSMEAQFADRSPGDRPYLIKFVAPLRHPVMEMRNLLGMNLGPAALFPDMEGACLQANLHDHLMGGGSGHQVFH